MTVSEIVTRIASTANAFKAEGATALYIYGSRARGTGREDSDLDVFVDYEPGSGFSLMHLAGIKLALEDTLGLDVSVTTRNSLHPMMKESIEREAVRVF